MNLRKGSVGMGAYDEYSGEELETELRDRGLAVSGTKAEKASRLEEDDSGGSDDESSGGAGDVGDDSMVEPGSSIEGDELLDPDQPFSAENPLKRAVVSVAEGSAGSGDVGDDSMVEPGSSVEGDELLDPDQPFSAENPLKRAVISVQGEVVEGDNKNKGADKAKAKADKKN